MALDVLLAGPEVRRWAEMKVSPLRERDPELYVKTLRAWLVNHARIEATATALGISVPGTRKRLSRIEEILGRSLMSAPSARYDLWGSPCKFTMRKPRRPSRLRTQLTAPLISSYRRAAADRPVCRRVCGTGRSPRTARAGSDPPSATASPSAPKRLIAQWDATVDGGRWTSTTAVSLCLSACCSATNSRWSILPESPYIGPGRLPRPEQDRL
jgi:hypothetical protein